MKASTLVCNLVLRPQRDLALVVSMLNWSASCENEVSKRQSDITIEELIEMLNLPIKKSRLSVVLIGMGISFKKDLTSKRTIEGGCSKRTFRVGIKNKRYRPESFSVFR